MTAVPLDNEFVHLQDLLGSLPMLRGFIPICLCFHLDHTTIPEVKHELESATTKLGSTFPFLTGRVLIDGISDGHSGVPKIVRYSDKIHLSVNDLTRDDSVSSSTEMRTANYPQSMLNPKKVLPPICFDPYPVDSSLFAPVFMVQANLIRGGLLLTFVGNHQIMDATGLGYLIELFAKALRGDAFTEDDIEAANQPRAAVIPLLDQSYQPGPELDDIIPMEDAAGFQDAPILRPNKCAWFRMTSADLERLKSDAAEQTTAPYVSTDDSVAAVLWQAVSRARQPRLGQNTRTQFTRPISVRKFFGLKRYAGHMADTIYTEAEDVYKLPLGAAAGKLRHDLMQEDKIRYHVQALATMCSRLADRSNLEYGANKDLNRDVLMSSWTNMSTCAYSYGNILGVPEATRCPWKNFVIPMAISLPKDKDGSMTLVVCFAEDEMDRMFEDQELLAYGRWMRDSPLDVVSGLRS